MKEEASISLKKKAGAFAVAVLMLLTVFAPVSAYGETEKTQQETADSAQNAQKAKTKTKLAVPANVKAKRAGVRSVRVTWSKTEGAAKYEIYRSKKKHGSYKRIAVVKGTASSYKNRNLVTGRAYYYKVRARAGSSKSAFSRSVKGKARPAATRVSAKAGEEKIRLSWKKVTGAHGYYIYHAKSENGKYKKLKTVKKGSSTTFTHSKLKAGKTHHYRVRAYRVADGKKILSAKSATVSAKANKVKLKKHKKGFEYKKKFTVKAYAYTGGGTTAMGTRARVGAIAVDPDVIPLGTKVYVEGYGYARAEDTGGNIKGKTVDLYMNSTSACMNWGVRYKTIYIDVRK